MGALPRTSVPGPLLGLADFERVVASYQRMNFIEDSSELWWDIRPSHNNPTIELRICDVCPRIEDAVSIAALYASLIRWLMRLDRQGVVPPEPPTEIIIENRWLAQRYGVLAFLGNVRGAGGRVDIEDYAAAIVETLADDAAALGCEAELRHALSIIHDGSSADRQIDHTVSAAWRATPRRRRCAAWSTWCWPNPGRISTPVRSIAVRQWRC